MELNGYFVVAQEMKLYRNLCRHAVIDNNVIVAGFCEKNDENSYRYIDGKIAADSREWIKILINKVILI